MCCWMAKAHKWVLVEIQRKVLASPNTGTTTASHRHITARFKLTGLGTINNSGSCQPAQVLGTHGYHCAALRGAWRSTEHIQAGRPALWHSFRKQCRQIWGQLTGPLRAHSSKQMGIITVLRHAVRHGPPACLSWTFNKESEFSRERKPMPKSPKSVFQSKQVHEISAELQTS